MTIYEIISTIIGILTLLCTFGGLIIACLSYYKSDKKTKK